MLDFGLFQRVVDEAAPVAGAHRLLQLRRDVPPQARGGDVRVHQVAPPARLPLHQHERPGVHRATACGASCGPASTRSPSRSTAPRPRATSATASGATSRRRWPTCARPSTRSAGTGLRPAVHQLALHPVPRGTTATARCSARAQPGGRHRRGPALLGAHGPPGGLPSRGASRRARRRGASIRHEIWDDNHLGNAIPGATPRARIEVRTGPRRAARGRPAGATMHAAAAGAESLPASVPRHRRRTAGAWCGVGAQLASADGTLIDRDYARARLPHASMPGGWADLVFPLPAPAPRASTRCGSTWSAKASTGSRHCGSEVHDVTLTWSLRSGRLARQRRPRRRRHRRAAAPIARREQGAVRAAAELAGQVRPRSTGT